MRIQHNIMAMNSYRNYTSNTSALAKNLEKLSSGYKINRAGDDAAGLAISEKMRAQISGLKQAQSNAKSGINLVQTAEGALTEVHDMLNRMVKLADQSANGTYDNAVDRANLQKEVAALQKEIDRIADASNFNGINLLDGSMGGPKVTATNGAPAAAGTASAASFEIDLAGATALENGKTYKLTVDSVDITSGTTGGTADTNLAAAFNGKTAQIGGVDYTISATGTKLTFTADTAGAASAPATTVTVSLAKGDATGEPTVGTLAVANPKDGTDAPAATAAKTEIDFTDKTGADLIGGKMEIGTQKYQFVEDAADVASGYTAIVVGADDNAAAIAATVKDKVTVANFTAGNDGNKFTLTETAAPASGTEKAPAVKFSGMGMTLQIGDTSDEYNKISVSVQDMHCAALGIDLSKVDISTQLGASKAVDAIKAAINTVSSVRGDLGATQNRLEHTMNNLSVMQENIQDAEATIRDVDVAEEMMAYTKNNILVQSAQAMLAQANQVPQGVLQLLQ